MLNKDGVRELAYVVTIDAIEPIVGSDNCEAAVVGGWRIMTRKETFKAGDLAIYFEIDSKVPETEQFAFLEKKHYKVKTQKYTFGGKGNFVSQGLLMHPNDFGWTLAEDADGNKIINWGDKATDEMPYLSEGDFLTQALGVVYADPDDNKRKGHGGMDKYKKMAQRRPEIFTKPWARWMMRRNWGKKIMFFFFGKKKDNRNWPAWVVKTDEERVQNMAWILEDKTPWYATEKIDGTSTTFTMKGYGRKREFYICSRNVVFDTPEKEDKCFYDTNVYTEMAQKYDVEHVLDCLMEYFSNVENKPVEFVTLQGETYGAGVQKRDYHLDGHDFKAFNLIVGFAGEQPRRLNPEEMTLILDDYGIPCVPIVSDNFVMPDTVDELLEIATDASAVDGDPREGLVFRSADGVRSFKAVSNEFLLKYHG